MSGNLINTLMLSLAFLLLFGLAELLHHFFRINAEWTRKIVHLCTGVFALSFLFLLDNHWWVLLMSISFLGLLTLSMKFNFLKSINGVDRITRGSLLFPVVVYGCFLVYDHYDHLLFYYLPLLILAICDPVAAYVGKNWPWKKYHIRTYTKTLSGSLGFLAFALLVSWTLLSSLANSDFSTNFILAIGIALATTVAEAVSNKGYDNLTIPIAAVLVLLLEKDYFII